MSKLQPVAPVVAPPLDFDELAARLAPRGVDSHRLALVLEASAIDARELDVRIAARDAARDAAKQAHSEWEEAASGLRAAQQSRSYRGQRSNEAAGHLGGYIGRTRPPSFGALASEFPSLGAWVAEVERVLAAGLELQASLVAASGLLPEVDEGPLERAKAYAAKTQAVADLAQLRLDALAAPLIAVARGHAA